MKIKIGNAKGPAGTAGKSYYQAAVESGYEGTENELSTALSILPQHINDPELHMTRTQIDTALLNKVNMPLAIPDGADLNNYTTPGMYYHGNGQAITNEPVFAPAFSLFVENTGAWQRGVKQTFTVYSNGDTYIRTNYIVTSGDWSAWVKLATTADLYHPNLLINSNFAINQRGKTIYTTIGYTVDDWLYIGEAGASITVEADGIRITIPSTTNGGAFVFDQTIERMLVDGEVCTGSINVAEVTGAWVFQLPNKSYEPSPVITTPGVYTATGDQARTNERMRIRLYTTTPGATIKVKWMKLEEGAIATPYIPPDPATEMLRCQRYLFPTRAQHYFSGSMFSASDGVFLIPTPCQMRIAPSLVVEIPGQLRCFDSTVIQLTPENYQILGADAAGIKLAIRGVSGAKAGAAVIADAMFLFSAEL